MDNKTISEAIDKASTTKFNIAYCDAHNDNHKLDERYLDFDMQPNASYLQNLLQINKFVADGLIATLRQPLNKDDYEVIQPISTSAYHWSDDNSIGKRTIVTVVKDSPKLNIPFRHSSCTVAGPILLHR